MKGKRENPAEQVNQNILNVITPTGLEFKKASFMLGENYAKAFTLVKYPSNPEYGWLSKLTAIEGTVISMEYTPCDNGILTERCNAQVKILEGDLRETRLEESVRQVKSKAVEDIRDMLTRITINNEVVGFLNVILIIQASDEKRLDERVKKASAIVSTLGGSLRALTFYQKEAYQAAAPYGIPEECLKDIGDRNMPISTFFGGFPNAASGINDGIGFIIGRTENGKPVIINTRQRNDDRTNSNWFISGLPGVGKSSAVKLIAFMEFALGAKLIFLDPEREYQELTRNLGGKVIKCGGGHGGKINPLQVRPRPKDEGEENNGISPLALHFQTLRTFHRAYKPEITDEKMDALEEILEKTYSRFGITWDTDTSSLRAEQYPIYSDLYEDLQKELKKNPENQLMKALCSDFRNIAVGADSFIFNGYTDIEFNTEVIDLDISDLMEGDPNILRAQFHNINSWVWEISTRAQDEMVFYIVDEGYLIVDPKNPEAFIFIKNYSKRIRKYGGGLMFITHAVADCLESEVKRHGQALLDTACYKLLMGTDGKNFHETRDLFGLTDAEETLLLSRQRGRGLLFAGSKRIAVNIEIPEKLLRLMGKAGGK